jgi:hypothetical protein
MAYFIRGGISKIGINIVGPYSFAGYFSILLVLKQNSPFFFQGIEMHHKASMGIHFSFKTLIFTLLNFLP